jgi:hypothetical protein
VSSPSGNGEPPTGPPSPRPPTAAAAAPSRTLADPVTGELLALDAPSDVLAAAVDEAKRRAKQYAEWQRLAEDELLERLRAQERRRATVGDWEIEIESSGRGRVWDPEELEATCRELLDAGTLQAREVGGLLTPQPPKVDGKLAARLLGRVTGDAAAALERCFEWQRKGRARLSVTRSIQLPRPDGSPPHEH